MTTTTADIATDPPHSPDTTTAHHPSQPQKLPVIVSNSPNDLSDEYPKWIGQKFLADGTLLSFPGNTILFNLPPNSNFHEALLNLHKDLQKQPFASLYAFLPPSSWHVTLFEGVCDQIRTPESWPKDLPLDVPFETCHESMRQKLETLDLGSEFDPPFQMAVAGWEPLEDGIALTVSPSTASETNRLRRLRDLLSECLGLRDEGHEHYVFHISLAYTLRYLTENQLKITTEYLEQWREKLPRNFELGRADFYVFGDMFEFRRVDGLGKD